VRIIDQPQQRQRPCATKPLDYLSQLVIHRLISPCRRPVAQPGPGL